MVMMARGMFGIMLGAAACFGSGLAAGQTQTAPSETYGSYLSAPAQENVMLQHGLDADELIGSEVTDPQGARLGAVTDLLVGADGRIGKALLDLGPGLDASSRHVAVDVARLQRASTTALTLDMNEAQLKALPAYRQSGERWEPAR